MEASAIKQMRVGSGVRHRTPLLRMQSDERLVALVRRGNHAAFGALVSRYESRLLAFCRHLLRSREDAEDVLQDVFASAFKAMIADDRPIKVRPWLYRIARNRCLNHLRRITAIGVDSIEDHFSEHGPSTSDAAQSREDLWQLVGDIQQLPESQRSALLLREMEALSYEQIAEVMDKTIPSVKSLLIRARRSLAESAEVRGLTCVEVMTEVGECHLGERARPSKVVTRHINLCARCAQLTVPETEALAGVRAWTLGPLAPLYLLKRLAFSNVLHSARAGSTATATAAGAAAGQTALGGSAAGGFISAGVGGVAGKAAVGLTAAALGVAGVVVDSGTTHHRPAQAPTATVAHAAAAAVAPAPASTATGGVGLAGRPSRALAHAARAGTRTKPTAPSRTVSTPAPASTTSSTTVPAPTVDGSTVQTPSAAPGASTGTVASGTPVGAATGGVAPTGQAGTGGPVASATTPPATTPTATTPTTPSATTPTTPGATTPAATTTPAGTTTPTTPTGTTSTPTDATPTGTTTTPTGTSTTPADG